MNNKFCVVLVLVGLSGLGQAALINGGFELPGPSGGVYEAVPGPGSGAITGWTTVGSGVEWMRPELVRPNWGPACEGNYIIDLANLSTSYGGVKQGFTAVIGQTYQFKWCYGTVMDLGRSGEATICFEIDDEEMEVYAINHTNSIVWNEATMYYTATRVNPILKIYTTFDGDDSYAFLDDVRMEVVPEPATMAALALGTLAILRRKRK